MSKLKAAANRTSVVSKPFKVVNGQIVDIIVPRGTITGGIGRKARVKAGY